MKYEVLLTRQAMKDAKCLKEFGLRDKANAMLERMAQDPYAPPYEKLVGNLAGKYSRRLNIHHRVVYEIDEPGRKIIILRMWTHYE